MEKKFMQLAIEEAFSGLRKNEGGPFGAVLVNNREIIAKAHNEVIKSNDPTAHAEILAIRRGSKKLGRFNLSDCEIYATCEPCSMCMSAIYWARIGILYYGCNKEDTVKTGFSDKLIYDIIKDVSKKKIIKSFQMEREACLKLFKAWEKKGNKVQY